MTTMVDDANRALKATNVEDATAEAAVAPASDVADFGVLRSEVGSRSGATWPFLATLASSSGAPVLIAPRVQSAMRRQVEAP